MTSRRAADSSKNWQAKVSQVIAKVFSLLKAIIKILGEIVLHVMSTVTFFFGVLVKILSNPASPCTIAILCFVGVMCVTFYQWSQIGVWLGRLLGFRGLWFGLSSGLIGMAIGLAINVFQNTPILWKVDVEAANAYGKHNVDVNFDTSDDNPNNRANNWSSFSHAALKKGRLVSYAIEAGIVISYVALAQSFNFMAIVIAAVSLVLPEKILEWVAAMLNLMGKVSEHIANAGTEEGDDFGGQGRAPKPGRDF